MTIGLWTNSQIKISTNWFGIIQDDHEEGEEFVSYKKNTDWRKGTECGMGKAKSVFEVFKSPKLKRTTVAPKYHCDNATSGGAQNT
jgi:hypothetical protein